MFERKIANNVVKEVFGYESINGTLSNKNSKRNIGKDDGTVYANMAGIKRWGAEDLQAMCGLLRQRQEYMPNSALFDNKQRRAAELVLAQEAINKTIDATLSSKAAWEKLPAPLREIAGFAKARYDKEMEFINANEAETPNRQAAEYKANLAKNTVKDILFTGMASIVNGAASGFINLANGTYMTAGEALQAGSSYALHYPVLEFYAQWVNSAGTIWSKLIKTVNMVSPESSMPIEHKSQVYVFRDKDGKIKKEIKREDYFRYMDMRLLKEKGLLPNDVDYMNQFLRKLVIQTANFNKKLKLHEVIAPQTEAILKSYQQAVFSFEIKEVLLTGETTGGATNKFKGQIYDTDGTPIQGTPLTEFHYNGRVLFLTPDATKPQEYYILNLYFDAKTNEILVGFNKSASTLTADIISIEFEVKVLDLPRVEQSLSQVESRTHKVTITAGPVIMKEVNFNPEYVSFLEAKTGSGKIVEDEINARTEELSHLAENIFINGYKEMTTALKAKRKLEDAIPNYQSYEFWAHSNLDLAEANALNKGENYNMRVSRLFQGLSTAYAKSANTQNVGMTVFCNVESLNPLNPAMMPIIGTVSSDTAGDFLGVVSPIEAHVFTAGTNNGPSPVKAVIVGTNKADFMPDHNAAYIKAKAANGGQEPSLDQISAELVHDYNICPQFAEPNLETFFMTRVALSMTDSSMGYRSETVQNVPHIQMKSGFKIQIIKAAGGYFSIKGYMAPPVNNWN